MSERGDLRDMVRRLLDERATSVAVREAVDTDNGFAPELWSTFADLGLLGLVVPEGLGGSGGELADMAVVLHELGRRAVPLPVISSALLAPTALLASANEALAGELLPRLASGEMRACVALNGSQGSPDSRTWSVGWSRRDGGYQLDGTAAFVLDAPGADVVFVGAAAPDGLLVVAVDADQVDVAATPVRDLTRRLGDVTLDGVVVGPERVLAEPGGGERLVGRLIDLGALAVSCDALGVAERTTEQTAAYARERHQFGRPIGSFQAVKHTCADMAVAVECGLAAIDGALAALSRSQAEDNLETTTAVSIAKAAIGDSAVAVCGDAVQMHGGIGFTWEHDAHLWLKRAVLDRALFGSPSWHRRRVADAVLPPAVPA